MFRRVLQLASVSLLMLAAVDVGTASAAATGTVSFTQPRGAVAGDEDIPVYLTVALDPGSDPLRTDSSGYITSGVTDTDLIAAGIDPSLIDDGRVTVSFRWDTTFTSSGTVGPPYDFTFNSADPLINANLDLEPGTTNTFLFGTFTPTGGSAPSGTYTFNDAAVLVDYSDVDGNTLGDIDLFSTCYSGDASCAFTRDVTGVAAAAPEPASWALMLGGFALAGAALRRRRTMAVSCA